MTKFSSTHPSFVSEETPPGSSTSIMPPLVCAFPFPHREGALQARHTQFLSAGMTTTLGCITAVFSFPKSNLENKALPGLSLASTRTTTLS